jgi:hypothetical protein
VIDETERHYIKDEHEVKDKEKMPDTSTKIDEENIKKEHKNSILPGLFADISIEDMLLLGLMFVIHQENPNDTILLFLLILLLAK